jgi:hypothetical protein
VAFALRPTTVIARSTTAAGAWAAIVALTVQNLADLGTEVPGLMLAPVVCAAIVVAGTHGRKSTWKIERWARPSARVAIGSCAAAVVAIVFALMALGHDLRGDRQGLRDAALVRRVQANEMHSLARAAMLRHPAEPYLPFVAGLRASYERDDSAVPWIGATLDRAQVYGPAHLVLARVVAGRSASQARFEYRLAMEQDPDLGGVVLAEAPRLIGGFYDAMELVPAANAGPPVIELIVQAVANRLPATCARLDAELARLSPKALGPAFGAARDAVQDIEIEGLAPWCAGAARAACVQLALDRSKVAEQVAPERCEGYALHARARVASGDAEGGLTEVENAADRVPARVACLQEVVAVAHRARNGVRAEAALDKIANAGCRADAECAHNFDWAAGEEEGMGNLRKALVLSKRAYERSPDDDSLLEQLARRASMAGLHAESAEHYARLVRKHPTAGEWQRAAAEERNAAARDALKL